LGVCYDIISRGEQGTAEWWEIGTADLTQDAPFSDFTGIARQFCVAEGTVRLTIDGKPCLCPVLSVTPFSGAADTSCTLECGAAKALNVLQSEGAERKLGMRIASSYPRDMDGIDVSSCECIVAVGGAASVSVSYDGGEEFMFDLNLLDALLWTGKERAPHAKLVVRVGSVAIIG